MSAAADVRPSSRGLVLPMILLLTISVALQVVRDRGWTPYRPAAPMLWLQAGPMARRLALGYDNLAADIYWMRAVVYYGGQRLAPADQRTYEQLFPLLRLVTTLDPAFKVAYRFGAIFLTEPPPNGPGRPDQAIDLLRRAIDANPDGWEYMHDTAFVYYWWLGDYRSAAAWFERAAVVPGAPAWLAPLAATTLAEGGDRGLSRQMWRQLRDDSDVAWIRRSAETRLAQLDALDAIDRLAPLVAQYAAAYGRPPAAWGELVTARLLPGIPLDPAGVPFVLDAATGRIDVARRSPLFPLPAKQRRGGA